MPGVEGIPTVLCELPPPAQAIVAVAKKRARMGPMRAMLRLVWVVTVSISFFSPNNRQLSSSLVRFGIRICFCYCHRRTSSMHFPVTWRRCYGLRPICRRKLSCIDLWLEKIGMRSLGPDSPVRGVVLYTLLMY